MADDHVARASTNIRASAAAIWDALTTPEKIKQYMFGTTVTSDFREGSPITWKGEWEGRPYEDKGEILKAIPNRRLQYTHFSPLAGLPDQPENYHTVTVDLAEKDGETAVSLAQNNNPTDEARQHSEKNWSMMLEGLKKMLEK